MEEHEGISQHESSSHHEKSSQYEETLGERLQLKVQLFYARVKHSRLSMHLLRRLVLAAIVTAILVVSIIFTVKDVKRRREEAQMSDFPDYGDARDRKMARKNLASSIDFPFEVGCRVPDVAAPRANASFVMLARNSELDDVVSSMRSMERHFNQWFNYPWVFLNDVEFDSTFKDTVKKHTNAEVEFGVVPPEHWNFPESVDRTELLEHMEGQGDREVMYGNMESYHKMCRFYSGHFFDHPLVRKREWYWRVEPDVKFFCDLTYDPFVEMAKNGKKYGFTVSIHELFYTVPSLFVTTKAFIKEKNIRVQSAWDVVVKKYQKYTGGDSRLYGEYESTADLRKDVEKNLNLKRFLLMKKKTNEDLEAIKEFKHIRNIFEQATEKPPLHLDKFEDEEYNLCHFWTNFEIARTDLFTSKTYREYFEYLEASGGFYKERWGDAPVHSLAVAMMLSRDELHYFRDIGYKHTTLGHCPNNAPDKQLEYQPSKDYKDEPVKPWYSAFLKSGPDAPVKNGVGCRCECPRKFRELEDKNSVCIKHYAHVVSDDYRPPQPVDLKRLELTVNRRIDKYLRQGNQLGHGSAIS